MKRGAALAGLTVAGVVAAGGAWWLVREPAPAEALRGDSIDAFLATHWQRPLPVQGTPPAHFSALEASLDPAACGQCHASQHADWSTSLHAQTMSAGVAWQLRLLPPDESKACLDCHAPLAEQKALVAQQRGWPQAPAAPPPAHVPAALAEAGLVCASCHVRQHQRYGPPKPAVQANAPHGGFTPAPAFGDSRFCASCHQFADDGPRTAGKLREDTYRQWLASPQAARGESCQSCHMPQRRHQWQGIHSPGMLRSALTATLRIEGGRIHAAVTNTGGGHAVPTYLVAKIAVQIVARGAAPRVLAEKVIGWQVDVSLEHEAFDTRLMPGATVTLTAALPEGVPPGAIALRAEVAPREHYERSFDASLAQAEALDSETLALLQQARREAAATRYSLVLAEGLEP